MRGRPFTGVPAHSFGWVFSELLVTEMEVAITQVTRRVVEHFAVRNDLASASWAVQQGLRAVPTDFRLWDLRLAVAVHLGSAELQRARRDAEASLGEDSAELLGRYPTG